MARPRQGLGSRDLGVCNRTLGHKSDTGKVQRGGKTSPVFVPLRRRMPSPRNRIKGIEGLGVWGVGFRGLGSRVQGLSWQQFQLII